jgi:hypothetical protein
MYIHNSRFSEFRIGQSENSRAMFKFQRALRKPPSLVDVASRFTNTHRTGSLESGSLAVVPNAPLTQVYPFVPDELPVSNLFSTEQSESSHMLLLNDWDDLQKSPAKVPLSQLTRLMDHVSKCGLPESVPMGSLRLGILARGRELSLEKLIQSLELMSSNQIPDHLFFKEIGRLLRGKVSDLTVGQICRILRAHAVVGCHEAELFHPIHDRLCVVVNKSSISQLTDILHSVSLVESSTFDCLNIAELCLNRYSLSLRDTSASTAIESRILAAMSRMRLLHAKTMQKMIKRLTQLCPSMPTDSLVAINNHLASLDCRPNELIPLPAKARPNTVPIPTVFGFNPSTRSIQVLRPIINGEVTSRMAYKSRMALAAFLSIQDKNILDSLSLADLRKLNEMIDHQHDTFREKTQSFFDYRGIVFDTQSVAGIFSINVARVLSKQERAGRVIKKR